MSVALPGGHAGTAHVRNTWAPQIVVAAPGRTAVTLLLVTEWLDHLSVHLSWPECLADEHRGLREAHHLTDASGRTCPLVASTVQPLAGRVNEVTFFDTSRVSGPQTLALRLRSRLAEPVPLPFTG
ncbi:hypothetical protein E4P41_07560 [Geodermatophilus sp. DF01-2]|uniref:hypothetical protein n=1 Tax=Geodermatophilus sp. DF01-2 TaxID=2559610 RepID=UPI0010742EE3|nr:hypothetical protein [Geodermatophilus sp. DF01_2]TFV62340.1 hypothetical protein E4P41_07560 [Geodermatophilus sp. DF01_2]